MITWRHASFIAQALESVLAQRTDFRVEIIVGEDASPDDTADIVAKYQERFPDRIQAILRPKNIGMLRNIADVLSRCRGEYVALLEGDDFWTDRDKLQKQVDFLRSRPDCVICHTNAYHLKGETIDPRLLVHSEPIRRILTRVDLLRTNPISTGTVLFRNGLIPEFPEWFFRAHIGDLLIHIFNARHGNIGYLDEVTGAYRVHGGSVWSSVTRLEQLRRIHETMSLLRPELTPEEQAILDESFRVWHEETVEVYLRANQSDEAKAYALIHPEIASGAKRLLLFFRGLEEEKNGRRFAATKSLFQAFFQGWGRTNIKSKDILIALARITCPRAYRLLSRIKGTRR